MWLAHTRDQLLSFDPLYVANETRVLTLVYADNATDALAAMRATHYGEGAVIIGRVQREPQKRLLLRTTIGGVRVVRLLTGEMLSRTC